MDDRLDESDDCTGGERDECFARLSPQTQECLLQMKADVNHGVLGRGHLHCANAGGSRSDVRVRLDADSSTSLVRCNSISVSFHTIAKARSVMRGEHPRSSSSAAAPGGEEGASSSSLSADEAILKKQDFERVRKKAAFRERTSQRRDDGSDRSVRRWMRRQNLRDPNALEIDEEINLIPGQRLQLEWLHLRRPQFKIDEEIIVIPAVEARAVAEDALLGGGSNWAEAAEQGSFFFSIRL